MTRTESGDRESSQNATDELAPHTLAALKELRAARASLTDGEN